MNRVKQSTVVHVFSEMEPYEETTAKEKAIAMVEMIRSYWMEQAQKYEARKMAKGSRQCRR